MLKYFVQQLPPARPKYVSFLTANFSHAGVAHLAINMLALSSFGSVLVEVRKA
jgi:membrane associated rhomboid family serine protease